MSRHSSHTHTLTESIIFKNSLHRGVTEALPEIQPDLPFPSEIKTDLSERSSCAKFKSVLRRAVLDSVAWAFLTALLTLFILFGPDFRLAFTDQAADPIFDAITVFALVVFALEILVSLLVKRGYFLSYFFVFDVIATASLVLDFTFVARQVLFGGDVDIFPAASSQQEVVIDADFAGARAERLIRMVRLVRLVRLVMLYKVALHLQKTLQKRRARKDRERTLERSSSSAGRRRSVGPGDSCDCLDDFLVEPTNEDMREATSEDIRNLERQGRLEKIKREAAAPHVDGESRVTIQPPK